MRFVYVFVLFLPLFSIGQNTVKQLPALHTRVDQLRGNVKSVIRIMADSMNGADTNYYSLNRARDTGIFRTRVKTYAELQLFARDGRVIKNVDTYNGIPDKVQSSKISFTGEKTRDKATGLLTEVIDEGSSTMTYTYDKRYNCIKSVGREKNGSICTENFYKYDKFDNQVEDKEIFHAKNITPAEGRLTKIITNKYTYDDKGNYIYRELIIDQSPSLYFRVKIVRKIEYW